MKRLTLTLAVAAAATVFVAQPADATTLILTLTDTTVGPAILPMSKTCDNGSLGGGAACVGTNNGFIGLQNGANLLFSSGPPGNGGNVGGFTLALDVANTNTPGSPGGATLGSTELSLTNTTGAARNFRILVQGFGYTTPAGDALFMFGSGSTSSAGVSGSMTVTSYFDPKNTGALLNAITCSVALGTNGSCAEPGLTVANKDGGVYSIAQTIDIIGLGAGQSVLLTANQNVTAVPEPGSLILLGTGLLGAARLARRRR